MTTEAEQLANELTEPVECFPEPTRLGADNAELCGGTSATNAQLDKDKT